MAFISVKLLYLLEEISADAQKGQAELRCGGLGLEEGWRLCACSTPIVLCVPRELEIGTLDAGVLAHLTSENMESEFWPL